MIEEFASEEIGNTLVELSSSCACGECNLGSFICDAFMHFVSIYETLRIVESITINYVLTVKVNNIITQFIKCFVNNNINNSKPHKQ